LANVNVVICCFLEGGVSDCGDAPRDEEREGCGGGLEGAGEGRADDEFYLGSERVRLKCLRQGGTLSG
jgi:hypothetical protein